MAREQYGLAGAVQHGASTLSAEAFDAFPRVGACEIHLATNFQNMVYDHPAFPAALKDEMYAWVRERRPTRGRRRPRWSAIWRSPASPRSWRTASTRRNIPYMPGWVYDSPPPLVLVGSDPPGPELPSSTNAPPSPLAQKPRSSRCSSTVM